MTLKRHYIKKNGDRDIRFEPRLCHFLGGRQLTSFLILLNVIFLICKMIIMKLNNIFWGPVIVPSTTFVKQIMAIIIVLPCDFENKFVIMFQLIEITIEDHLLG